jgi:hypothetical protein
MEQGFRRRFNSRKSSRLPAKPKARLVSPGFWIYAGARACATESSISSPCCKASNGLSWCSSDNCRSFALTISLHSLTCLRYFRRFTWHLISGKPLDQSDMPRHILSRSMSAEFGEEALHDQILYLDYATVQRTLARGKHLG